MWLLLAVALSSLPQSQAQNELPAPVNLSIKSHDFHTVLKWNVLNATRMTRFNVDFCDYETAHWQPICVNISEHYCDLSNVFVATQDLTSGYYARVAAVTASQMSTFSYTYRFTFGENATLGPPIVQLSVYGNDLTVEVKYLVHNSTSRNVPFKWLSYIVRYRIKDHQKEGYLKMSPRQPIKQFKVQEGIILCASAGVHLKRFGLKGKQSEEKCIIHLSQFSDSKTLTWPPPLKIEGNITFHTNELDNLVEGEEVNSNYQEDDYDYQEDEYDNLTEEEDENEYLQENDEGEQFQHPFVSDEDPKDTSVVIPIVLVLVVVVSLISAVMYTLKHKKKVVFPKSLTHFIENKRPCYVLNLKTEESTKCIVEQLEEVKNDPEINQKYKGQEEVVNSLDNGDNDTINTDGGSNELVDTEWTDPYAAKIEINGTDQKTVSTENVEIDINDLDSNHDICQTHFESMKQNCTADHWGYDKPQIPLNMC